MIRATIFEIKNLIRSTYEVHIFLFKYRLVYYTGIILFFIGLISDLIDFPDRNIISIIIFSISIFVSILSLILDIRRSGEEKEKYSEDVPNDHVTKLTKLNITDEYTNSGYIIKDFCNKYVALYSDKINKLIRNENLNNSFEIIKSKAILPSAAKLFAPKIIKDRLTERRGTFFNDKKIRLRTDLTSTNNKSKSPIQLQKTDYYSGICTNEMTGKEVKRKENNDLVETIYDGYSFFCNNNTLLKLEDSNNKCSNHIGVSTLAISMDKKIVISKQSGRTIVYRNKLVPTGSGSADYRDFKSKQNKFNFKTTLIKAMNRELLEETSLKKEKGLEVKTKLIGYARLLDRGGKPDFFGVSFLNVNFEKIKVSGVEKLYIDIHKEIEVMGYTVKDFLKSIESYEEKNKQCFSLPLYLNIQFLKQFIEENNELFLQHFEERN